MQNNLAPGGNSNNKHQIELFLRGQKFQLQDDSFKLTTHLEIFLNNKFIGKTETVDSSNRPRYDKTIVVDYIFEKNQNIEMKLVDHKGEILGLCNFPVGALVGSKSNSLKIPLETTGNVLKSGFIKVMYEGISSEELRLKNSAAPLITRATFSEHLNGGLNISVVVCIDFTVSNGYCNSKFSLHHISDDKLNDYQMAITSVCSILLKYDNDSKIPVYGFGAKPLFPNFNTNGRVSHFFPCSGDWNNCAGSGIQDLFDIYSNCLNNVELSGPTYFEPLLEEVCKFAEEGFKKDPQNYTVLLILTDGVIHDMEETIDLVVKASELPLSIIIVGVGKENFENMKILDDDSGKLQDEDGKKPSRDIIQFVEFNHFKDKDMGALAEEVLQELPEQVCSFMERRGIKPKANIADHDSTSNDGDDNTYYPHQDDELINQINHIKKIAQSDNTYMNQTNHQPANPYNYTSEPRRMHSDTSNIPHYNYNNIKDSYGYGDKQGFGGGQQPPLQPPPLYYQSGVSQKNSGQRSGSHGVTPVNVLNSGGHGVYVQGSQHQGQGKQGLGFDSMAQNQNIGRRDFGNLNFHKH